MNLVVGQANFIPSSAHYSSSDYPISLSYQSYVSVSGTSVFTPSVQSGPSAISVGVMNGTATVQVSQGGQVLLSRQVGGPLRYVVVTASASYSYVNFDSNGQTLQVSVSTVHGKPLVAYNVYDNYISNYTATLITYPPQFAVNMGPPDTPTNTGLSFLLVAPKYTQPTPLAIWVGEGYSDLATGKNWWAQIGFNNWAGDMNVSYAGWGIFSNIFGNPGGTDYNYPLVPGDTYNFTMALVSGTTWEFAVNGTLIQEGSLTGLFDTTTTVANEGTDLGLETLTAWGGNVNITNQIGIPVMASFRVDGKWSEPSSFTFGSIGENWWNNVATSTPGIDLWGIAGHLQNSSIPNGSLLFDDPLPMVLDVPTTNSEPLYGGFSLTQKPVGDGIVDVSKISNTSIIVSPVSRSAFVSVASYMQGSANLTSLSDALVTTPEQFNLPEGSGLAVVYASNIFFNSTSVSVVQIVPREFVTSTEVKCSSPTIVNSFSTECTATITGSSPTGTVSWSQTGSGSVSFDPTSCTIYLGECQITVTGTTVGSVNLTASYDGDSNNLPSSGSFSITVYGTTVTCTPLSVVVGSYTICTARVSGSVTPTGRVAWSTSDSGKFSAHTCKLTGGSCSVTYTPTSASTVIITASYAGDKHNSLSSGTFSLSVTLKTSTTKVSCSPASVVVGSTKTIKCTAAVTGYKPSGTVTWSQSTTNTGSVSFTSSQSPITCSLNAKGRCSVTMTDIAAGTVTIQAAYGGDGSNTPSSGTAGLTIKQAKTRLSLTCTSTSKDVWDCTAILKGYYGSVTGEAIAWTQTAGTGIVSFSSPTCTLSSGFCSVTVSGTLPGKATIEAVYARDTNNLGSSKTASLKVT